MVIDNVTIKDVCTFVGGSQPPKKVFVSEYKTKYIRLIQIRDYKTDKHITYIPIELAKKKCTKDDIMIGRYGPPIFQILRGLEGAYNVALMKAIPKENILHEYLYYLLKQESIFKYVEKLSPRTSGQTGVDVVALNNYPVILPPKNYQKKIVDVLGKLDRKITLNNLINVKLESMAKLLYDYWFVQFDFPNKEGKPYKSSGGKMIYNKKLKRKIPEGWREGNLSDLGEIFGGSTPSKAIAENFTKEGMGWITPKDLSINKGKKYISKGELDVSQKGIKQASLNILPKGTVLLSSRAPIGYMAIARNKLTTNQGFKSFVPKKGYSTEFIYYTIKNSIKTIERNASGSTFKEISLTVLKTIETCLPDTSVINLYTETVNSIFKKQNVLEKESKQLAAQRDWLLPLLMNGQVRVK